MPGYLLDISTQVQCVHAGQGTTAPGNPRVKVLGQPVATMAEQTVVAGCTFTLPGPKPSPCVLVEWLQPATRIKAGGQPVLLQNGTALCKSAEQAPQGSPTVVGQTRVRGT